MASVINSTPWSIDGVTQEAQFGGPFLVFSRPGRVVGYFGVDQLPARVRGWRLYSDTGHQIFKWREGGCSAILPSSGRVTAQHCIAITGICGSPMWEKHLKADTGVSQGDCSPEEQEGVKRLYKVEPCNPGPLDQGTLMLALLDFTLRVAVIKKFKM